MVLGVDAPLGGTTIRSGTSLIALAPLIAAALQNPAIATAIPCTADNNYGFNPDGTYSINGCTDFILPKSGNSGKWEMTVFGAVVQLTSESGIHDSHWIDSVDAESLQLTLTVSIPGIGAAPLVLILEKQQ